MAEIFEPGCFYHIFNRGNNKEDIFIEEKNYSYFLNLVKKYLLPICEVFCYCFLKNHFHLMIRIKDIEDLPKKIIIDQNQLHQPFSNLFNAYTKGINNLTGRTGSLFQKSFHKIRITDLSYLQNLIIYIHLNPVKHDFLLDFKNYRHSSYQTIISDKPTKLKRDDVIKIFDDKSNFIYCHDLKRIKIEGVLKEIDELDG